MSSDSGLPEKMDALDLIINALKEHEKRLDDLSHRLESVFVTLQTGEVAKKEEEKIETPKAKRAPLLICERWNEFKDMCRGAKTAAFQVERNFFHVYSTLDEGVLTYSENLPDIKLKVTDEDSQFSIDKSSLNSIELLQFLIEGKLRCGLRLALRSSKTALPGKRFLVELRYEFNPDEMKGFLSRELGISKSNIVEGKITY